jgi:pimeloyl-ACP methyl ester carboxylesterase
MLAVRFALMKPEMITALVLANPIGLEDWKRVVPYRSVDEWTANNEKATPDGIRKYMLESYFGGQWQPEYDALAEIQAGWAIGPDHSLIARVSALHYDMIFTQPVVHEFADLEVPTLLVIGQRDRTALGKDWVSPEVAKTLGDYPALGKKAHEAIEGSKLVEIDDVGHIPPVESPEAWLKALLGFLG